MKLLSSRARLAGLGAVAILALALSACSASGGSGGSGSSGDTKEVGVTKTSIALATTNTLSGAGAASCAPSSDAAKLWFDKVNADGGINGRKINYDVLDDGYDPARALANIRSFETSKFAVVGACGSATTAAVYQEMSRAGFPLLFPVNGTSAVVKPASKGIFQALPLYEDQSAAMVDYGFKKFGKGSVFVVVNPLGAYSSVIDNAKTAVLTAGGKFVNSAVANLGTPDYTPIALQIKQAKPDYVLISMGGTDGGKFVSALAAQDAMPNKAVLGTTGPVAGAFLTSYDPSVADKLYLGAAIKLPVDPTSPCGKLLKGAQRNDPIAITGCGEAQAITAAIKQTKPLTRENLDKTIESWKNENAAPGVFAPFSFSATNHVGISQLFIVQPKGDAFHTIASCPYGVNANSKAACKAIG
jgi:ABC-type branched-subunit amino acid transport system substrate-binding protein